MEEQLEEAGMDLTKIEKPFGLLDPETQAALRAHGGPYEYWDGRWRECSADPMWHSSTTYRVKPDPTKKPSINWDDVASGFDFLVVDEDGNGWLSCVAPELEGRGWWIDGITAAASAFPSYRRGGCDWRDSLVERPE
jgi:hypothetical protein